MDEIYVTYVDDEHVDNHDYDDTTIDDDHDHNNDICGHICYIDIYLYPDRTRTRPDRTGPGPDRSGPGRTEPDQSKIHYIQSKYRVDHCLQSWIGPRAQL